MALTLAVWDRVLEPVSEALLVLVCVPVALAVIVALVVPVCELIALAVPVALALLVALVLEEREGVTIGVAAGHASAVATRRTIPLWVHALHDRLQLPATEGKRTTALASATRRLEVYPAAPSRHIEPSAPAVAKLTMPSMPVVTPEAPAQGVPSLARSTVTTVQPVAMQRSEFQKPCCCATRSA